MSTDVVMQKYELSCLEYLVDRSRDKFNNAKFACTMEMLKIFDIKREYMELTMAHLSPTSDGFYSPEIGSITFDPSHDIYRHVEGIRINNGTGEIKFLFTTCGSGSSGGLFTSDDVNFLFQNEVKVASFSLDPLFRDARPQPLQEATIQPPELEGTSINQCFLRADLLLKFLKQGVEVSAIAPYQHRPIDYALSRLPPFYRHLFRSVKKRIASMSDYKNDVKVSRTWLDCQDIDYETNRSADGWTTYRLGRGGMVVKSQIFRALGAGETTNISSNDYLSNLGLMELVPGDGHTLTAEEMYVQDVNSAIDIMCYYFPDWGRLAQLFRIICLVNLVHKHLEGLTKSQIDKIKSVNPHLFGTSHKASSAKATRKFVVPSLFCSNDNATAWTTQSSELEIGELVDLMDECYMCYNAEVVRKAGDYRCFRYCGWSNEYDVWFHKDSPRIHPLNTHTTPGVLTGPGSAVFCPPPTGTAVRMQRDNTYTWSPGSVIASTATSFTAQFDDSDATIMVSKENFVWNKVHCVHDINTPASIHEIENGNVHLGQSVDVRDEYFNWYTGTIVGIDLNAMKVEIKYDSWENVWNAWISLAANRIAPLHTHTSFGERSGKTIFEPFRVNIKSIAPPIGTVVSALRESNGVASFQPARIEAIEHGTVQQIVQVNGTSQPVIIDPNSDIVNVRFIDTPSETKRVFICQSQVREAAPHLMNPVNPVELASFGDIIGKDIDIRSKHLLWSTGEIIAKHETPSGRFISVMYHGYGKLYSERIPFPSLRIQPLHTHTLTGHRTQPGDLGRFVIPPVGTEVYVRCPIDDGEYKPAKVHVVEDKRFSLQVEGLSQVLWLSTFKIGAVVDRQQIQSDVEGSFTWVTGGIKIKPNMKPVPTLPAVCRAFEHGNIEQDARSIFQKHGIRTHESAPGKTKVIGLRCDTIDYIFHLRQSFKGEIIVTGAAEPGKPHGSGTYSHENGYKVDIGYSKALHAYFQSNYSNGGERKGEHGGPRYVKVVDGKSIEVVYEENFRHFDITVKPM